MMVCPNDLKILKTANEVWKLWDLYIPHDIMCEVRGKNLNEF
jgi:hypothetical protein